MRPTTLREKVDSIAHELMADDTLFSGVLDRFIEKKGEASTPPEVLRIAAQVEKEAGLSKEAALHTAWETYVRYVNPDFLKQGGHMPPQFMKKKDKKEPIPRSESMVTEKGKAKASVPAGIPAMIASKMVGGLGLGALLDQTFYKWHVTQQNAMKELQEKHDRLQEEVEELSEKTSSSFHLAEKLGMKVKAEIVKEAPKGKKMVCKTAEARKLAEALGV